jgi:hypothetical protein
MTEESQSTWDEEQEQEKEDASSEEGPAVTEAGGTLDPGESEEGHEGSAGQEPGDPGREA